MLIVILMNLFFCLMPGLSDILSSVDTAGELKLWHTVTLTFDGPDVSEHDEYNPFLNYRLNVTFHHMRTRKTYVVPGYFAADGDAANSSAQSGNKWRVHFCPDELGEWLYHVDFRKGNWVAVSDRTDPGESAGFMDGVKGSFPVAASDKSGLDFRARGRLQYAGGHYLKCAADGEYFIKVGVDAPENFLAYADFDGTFHDDGHKDELVKTWEPHVRDWKTGDPVWQNGKGKGIIGALNYLASEGLNAVSFLTMNIAGDDQNVFPYIDYDTFDRFDVSKLDQWDIVFTHAQKNGIFLHFKTQESENQGLLDNGGVGVQRKLYYRELIARFGHHLALNWNLGEENGDWVKNHPTPPQFKWQRRAMAEYFYNHDPYKHHIVIHNGDPFYDLLGEESKLTGPSVQTHRPDFSLVHDEVVKWRQLSRAAGKTWAVSVDEPGDAQHALVPDKDDKEHHNARKNALWGAYIGGAWGIEWYFGYKHDHSDLTCQDFRSRDLFWNQCRTARQFMTGNDIPYWDMQSHDELLDGMENWCLAKPGEIYVLYMKNGGDSKLNLRREPGDYYLTWFNPRTGEWADHAAAQISGDEFIKIAAPTDNNDWVGLVKLLK